MKVRKTELDGVYKIENFYMKDSRGSFEKIFNSAELKDLNMEIKEVFYSKSNKNTIRGLHFQNPPFAQDKIVTVMQGRVIDVVVDIRKDSKTFGKYLTFELSADDADSIFIPKGYAHGFKTLEDNTTMLYLLSEIYNRESDSGIKWDSIDFNWDIQNPIISDKDLELLPLKDLVSLF